MSWTTARATLKMTETELTRRHSVRTVRHINTLPQNDFNFLDFSSDSLVSTNNSNLRSVNALRQRLCHFPASVISHAATILSASSSHDATRADTSRSDLVSHVNALADVSNVRGKSSLPLGHADVIRAVRHTLSIRDPHLLDNVERVQKRSFKRRLHSQLRTG